MKRYRKKPVEIQAIKFEYDADGIKKLREFAGDAVVMVSKGRHPTAIGYATIATLEGNITATEGDYIIKGVKGEFYPCKPDIFEATYEEVDELAEALHKLYNSLSPTDEVVPWIPSK